jgi:N-acyl-D-amino-acid deacylase
LFPLEDAVRRMTSLPAATFGLTARGSLKEGYYADICVFDAETVIDTADFTTPISPAMGIELVLVNGKPAYGGDVARAGKVLLRHELQAEAATLQ